MTDMITMMKETVCKDLSHPIQFSKNLYHDAMDCWEDLIDKRYGQLPKNNFLFEKALSLVFRIGGLTAIAGTITFTAIQLSLNGTGALGVYRIFQRVLIGTSGFIFLSAGQKIRTTYFCGPWTNTSNLSSGNFKRKATCTFSKIRLGWRQYLYKVEGESTSTGENKITQYRFTAKTYLHNERDPSKRHPLSGNTQIISTDGIGYPDTRILPDCHLSFGKIPADIQTR